MKRLIYCVNVSSPDLSVDKPPVAAADNVCVMTSDDVPSEPQKSVDKLSAVRAMPCYDVPSEPCSVDKSSDGAMTSEDVDKSVDKPPAAVPSWPPATVSGALRGASLINDFLGVPTGSGNNPSLIKAYGLTRSALQKMSSVKFVKMSALELKTFVSDNLWEIGCRNDGAGLEGLIWRLGKLKRATEKYL